MNKMPCRTGCGFAIGRARSLLAPMGKGLCFGLLAAGCLPYQAAAADSAAQLSRPSGLSSAYEGSALETPAAPSIMQTRVVLAPAPKRANFEREHASHEARHVADWVVDSGAKRRPPVSACDNN